MIALINDHTEVATALLACPAVVSSAGVADNSGDTALMIASIYGYTEIVMALLRTL
jgi:ankyrin repeat protein